MKNFWISIKLFLWMTLITGVIYPVVITIIAQTFMHHQANGSILENGSKLIAQKFTQDKYFWPRPSANDYNPLKSGGSNLPPFKPKDPSLPPELQFASASGLDPHISLQTADFQVGRVSKARGISEEEIKKIIKELSIGIPEARYVNVLELNLALDKVNKK